MLELQKILDNNHRVIYIYEFFYVISLDIKNVNILRNPSIGSFQ